MYLFLDFLSQTQGEYILMLWAKGFSQVYIIVS